MNNDIILSFNNVTKYFTGVTALQDVCFSIERNTVHALIGENGAGKSTLMKILFGIHQPDGGFIEHKKSRYTVHNPRMAMSEGISMIPQEINPVNNLSVASNIYLGKEFKFGPSLVNQRAIDNAAEELLKDLGIEIDPRLPMSNLSIASAQLIAIATAISDNSEIIIMDEPTSALTEKESLQLLHIIRNLKKNLGITVIYISHKLDELFAIADNYTVLRDGQSIKTGKISHVKKSDIINMMVGRTIEEFFQKTPVAPGEVIMSVKDLCRENYFNNASFDLRAGEILGFAGLIGAGRTELMEAIFGLTQFDSGSIILKGKECRFKSPLEAIRARIGFVTEDRKASGIFPDMSVKDNMIMPDLKTYKTKGLLDDRKIVSSSIEQKDALRIKTPTLEQLIKNLSGGNQQKVLISRWLLMQPEILILDEPTRGIDVGAKAEIHMLISKLAQEGKAIILISSEMPEIISMSDRILVMHEGCITGELSKEQATQEMIMNYATGEKTAACRSEL